MTVPQSAPKKTRKSKKRINEAKTLYIGEDNPQLYQEPNIEPRWEGIGRSVNAGAFWLMLILFIAPLIAGSFYALCWWLLTGYSMDALLAYALGVATSVPVVKNFDDQGRVFLHIDSNHVAILTQDIPHTAKREAQDAREEKIRASCKLGEGGHILFPWDQVWAIVPIEVNFPVKILPFLVSLEDEVTGKKVDLLVEGNANFENDPENLYRFVRIDRDPEARQAQLIADLVPLIHRLIQEECRKAEIEEHLFDALSETSSRINQRIIRSIEHRYYGIRLKKFTLGNIDHTDKTKDARDASGALVTLTAAAKQSLSVNEGLDPNRQIGAKDALENAMIVGGIKTVTREEKSFEISQSTISAAAPIIEALTGRKVKLPEQPAQPES